MIMNKQRKRRDYIGFNKIWPCVFALLMIFYIPILSARSNQQLQTQQTETIPLDFPLIIYPTLVKNVAMPMVFMISGDGGWTKFDNAICENLSKNGLAVVALDAQKYFWNSRSPLEASFDIARSVGYYMQLWNKKEFILFGFSFGASIAPFITGNLPEPLQKTLKGIYCLSPNLKADFEIHLGDMLGFGNKNDTCDVLGQMVKMKRFHPTCIFGEDEPPAVRTKFRDTGLKIITIPGNHHYNNDAIKVAGAITDEVIKTVVKN